MSNNSNSSSSTFNTDVTTGVSNEFNVSRQKLEPTGNVSIGEFLQIVDKKKIGTVCPPISHVGPSKLLDQVKCFLPKLEAAEVSLKSRIEAGENVDVEKIDEENKAHIEMDLGFTKCNNSSPHCSSGSSDSEPDSPPSPADRDNSYTSDTDVDTSSSPSSCSCKSAGCPSSETKDAGHIQKPRSHASSNTGNPRGADDNNPAQNVTHADIIGISASKRKWPLIEDITDSKLCKKEQAVSNYKETNYTIKSKPNE